MGEQKKAVVVGGSNGIGLAISKNLIERGYYLEICDRHGPDEGVLDQNAFTTITAIFSILMRNCSIH